MKLNKELLVINFFIGGITVVCVSFLANYVNPILAAILWSFPFTIVPAIDFLYKCNRSHQYVSNFLKKSSIYLILCMMTVYLMGFFIGRMEPYDKNYYKALLKSTICWILISSLFYYGMVYYNTEDKKS